MKYQDAYYKDKRALILKKQSDYHKTVRRLNKESEIAVKKIKRPLIASDIQHLSGDKLVDALHRLVKYGGRDI